MERISSPPGGGGAYRDGERTPYAMQSEDGAVAYLFYDQVGSLRVVVNVDGEVIKEVLYDPFGGIIEDTNPGFRIPLGFAGGLHDRGRGCHAAPGEVGYCAENCC